MGREGREGGFHTHWELLDALGTRKRESLVPFLVPADPPGVPDGGLPIVCH